MSIARREDGDTEREGEIYLRDLGVTFDEQDERIYEQAQRSRGRRRGGYISPPPPTNSPPPLPPLAPLFLQTQRSPPPTAASYPELLAAIQRQQQAIARLRAANEEHAHNEECLRSDLLDMTHRYLQAQSAADALEKRRKEAEKRADALSSELKQLTEGNRRPDSGDIRSPATWRDDQATLQDEPINVKDRADTATVSAGTVDSSEYVAVDLSSLNIRPTIPPEEMSKLISTINLQVLEVARACIASASFRPGVRMMQVDNKMVVDVTDAVGCIMVQILRSRDHSKNKSIVELGLRALLSYHVSKLMDDWPFHVQEKRASTDNTKDSSEDQALSDKEDFSVCTENALRDIAATLSLCGSPGQPSSLVRRHRDRIGSTLDALFKTTECLASKIKAGRFDGQVPAEYSFLYARPGATFNKELMQKYGAQPSMGIWKTGSKKPVQVLCTKEIGIARLRRAPVGSSSLSSASSLSGDSDHAPSTRDIEVLSRVVVVFESDLDK